MSMTNGVENVGLDVSRETLEALETFEALVRRWNPAINLVSKSTLPTLRERHTLDSAQLFAFCPTSASHWVDLGSGGGFPGIIIAVLARDQRPGLRVTLVESDARKATFLRESARVLGLGLSVMNKRIETLPALNADVLSARALAPLVQLLGFAHTHLREDGLAILPKGGRHADELAEARRKWEFELEAQPSLSDPEAAIFLIRKINRAHES